MKRILFITATRIGDAVLFSGPLAHLARRWPDARITVACGPLAAPLFRAAPGVSEVIVMAKRKGGGHWLDLWRRTAGTRWDLVVDMRASLTGWFLRARELRVNWRRPGEGHRHRVIEAAAVLGLDADPPAPQLWVDAQAEAEAERRLPGDAPVLALAPAAAAPFKEWPAERFAALANALTGPGGALQGARVAIFGGPGDKAVSDAVRSQITQAEVTDLTGALDLVEAAACLKRARLFVGNDSGLMHMAAAAGAPVLGLFGPTDERVYGPWGPKARCVRAGGPADEADRERLRHADSSLMGGLDLERVLAAAAALIEESQA
ncbi:glycosyltransferase family 9 protein [Alkalicaulis satelles]|uniref:Glycosyltransferase family 9 protein n=1 Tax=Alkalicaulis satelles TaxID=2609175 RepID=A0A5M6ZKU1_9PROT|nr:glycosyltransferase family 9 protein [Alkalicaulis satelles]KAA5804585.1 glycosyltransferase family 9 protein [Alkalicaulis satelles]